MWCIWDRLHDVPSYIRDYDCLWDSETFTPVRLAWLTIDLAQCFQTWKYAFVVYCCWANKSMRTLINRTRYQWGICLNGMALMALKNHNPYRLHLISVNLMYSVSGTRHSGLPMIMSLLHFLSQALNRKSWWWQLARRMMMTAYHRTGQKILGGRSACFQEIQDH